MPAPRSHSTSAGEDVFAAKVTPDASAAKTEPSAPAVATAASFEPVAVSPVAASPVVASPAAAEPVAAAKASQSAVAEADLRRTVAQNLSDVVLSDAVEARLEDVVRELIRPMVRNWLDQNLERIAADVVREERDRTGGTGEA